MTRIIVATAFLLAATAGVYAQFNGCPPGFCSGSVAVAQPTGKLLLVDGVSFILQTDAASKICLAGGC